MANILLVDDDSSVLLTLAIALRRYGHSVTMAGDGPKALDQLQQRSFQFLVSDVRMPDISGFELARRARRLPQPPRVILTSAYSNLGTTNAIVEAFLQKPIDIAQLDALLHRPPPAPNGPEARASNSDTHDGQTPFRPLFSTGR